MVRKYYRLFFLILLLLLAVSGCSTNEPNKQTEKTVDLTVSAAASLQDALNDIQADFQKNHPTIKIRYNFGGSGALQQQITQGAPVDLFFSAAEDQFSKLVKNGLIEKAKGADLVGNELVLIVPKDPTKKITAFEDLTKADKLAIGTPESVPAGQYAKDTLTYLNLWKAVADKIVYAKDVRQVLTYVETNNVDAGIVYKTDAMISTKVKIVATAKESTHAPIVYPVGIIKSSSHLKEAKLFYDYLHSEKAIKIFDKYGFKGLVK